MNEELATQVVCIHPDLVGPDGGPARMTTSRNAFEKTYKGRGWVEDEPILSPNFASYSDSYEADDTDPDDDLDEEQDS